MSGSEEFAPALLMTGIGRDCVRTHFLGTWLAIERRAQGAVKGIRVYALIASTSGGVPRIFIARFRL